jgi:hypothetical protein
MKHVSIFAAVVAMFVGFSAVQAQNADPAARDWREIVSPQDRADIEGWQKLFDEHLTKAETLPDAKFLNFDRASLTALRSVSAATSIQPRWAGQWPCRTVLVNPKTLVIAYDWFACRIRRDGSEWWVEKYTGSVYFDYRLMPGGPTGVVAFGDSWVIFGGWTGYDPTGSNPIGAVTAVGREKMRIVEASRSQLWITEIDLTKRIR